jgi:ring-1,2-phenylacetyl-CoA epoxidase subunit PaaE
MVLRLFKKAKKNKLASRYFELVVREVKKETPEASTIIFDDSARKMNYQPGQFLTLIVDINGKEERRSYSLCTSPYSDPYPAVTIKKDPRGKVSGYLVDNLKVGQVVRVMEPAGSFTVACDLQNQRHLVMIGAGSGITPLMSIIRAVLNQESKSLISLVYASRNQDSIIFRQELTQLEEKYSGRMKVVHVLSQPTDEWEGFSGRLKPENLVEILQALPDLGSANTEYYLCGPQELMDMVTGTLIKKDVPQHFIHRESFTPTTSQKQKEMTEEKTRKVKIILDGEEHEITVEPGKAILETALDLNIDMPFSCQSGICTACRCKKISGEVRMEEDQGLSQKEKDEGYVLVCVGHPVTDDVVLEVG